ncbi:MAG TPA: EamA family transporter [Acidimicrobiales bacterium]|nr:EamA family transporter [Acidimicrobiales bacterium]
MKDPGARVDVRTLSGAGFLLAGVVLVQWSAALVVSVFHVLGASATSAWRFLIGALVLVVITRPRLSTWTRTQWIGASALGVSTAFMNQCFYQALARIPLGGAVAIEFLGPLCVAALARRTWRHFAFVVLAGLGVLALTHPGNGLTLVGVLFAAGSGLGWALYVICAARVGGLTRGFDGLAVSMSIAAIVTLPFSLPATGRLLGHPHTLVRLAIVAVMAIVLSFGADLQGLRRVHSSVAGVLLAFDPAVAFLIGWMLLNQTVSVWDVVGLACVVVAGVAVTYNSRVAELGVAP